MDSATQLKQLTLTCILLSVVLPASVSQVWAEVKYCGKGGPETLKPFGSPTKYMTDLVVLDTCNVVADPGNSNYYFHNVNVVTTFDEHGKPIKTGWLKFNDSADIDFYAESIVVENGSKLSAATEEGFLPKRRKLDDALPYQKKLTIHLWGSPDDAGIECKSTENSDYGPCGIPKTVWDSNPTMAEHLNGKQDPPPIKNMPCKSDSKYTDGKDCFYQYEIQDQKDKQEGRKAYFGHKVLAISYGGSVQLFGSNRMLKNHSHSTA